MSRIGKQPVVFKSGTKVSMSGRTLAVETSKGRLEQWVDPCITVEIDDSGRAITFSRKKHTGRERSMHGLYRSLLNNMVTGVSQGFKKELILSGVGFRANTQGQVLELNVGYSHPVMIGLPPEVKVNAEQQKGKDPVVTLESIDYQLLGQMAAKIRSVRKPEPYKGKGIRYADEYIRRKAGKSAAAAK